MKYEWLRYSFLWLLVLTSSITQASPREEIFAIFDILNHTEEPQILQEPVYASDTLGLFYNERDYEPAWQGYEYVKRIGGTGSERDGGLEP